MPKELIFVSVFDLGSVELGLNHLQSLRNAGIENYVAYATDRTCQSIVKSHGFNVKLMEVVGEYYSVEKKKVFGDKDFTWASFLRYEAIAEELKTRNVWYLDADTVVLSDLNLCERPIDTDIVFQNDVHEFYRCTGCMLITSNSKTKKLIESVWKCANGDIPDQPNMHRCLEKSDLITNTFNLSLFRNGLIHFDAEDLIETYNVGMKDIWTNVYFDSEGFMRIHPQLLEIKKFYENGTKPKMVHANWIVGIDNKIKLLKKKNLWFSNP